MNVKVSVIIPTYNRARLIAETINSVLKQDYRDFEIIVADDGSTDNTKEILSPFQEKKFVKFLRLPHFGNPAKVRNLAVQQSSGEYLAFLDSDDLWLPNKLSKQMRIFQKNPQLGLIYGDCEFFGDSKLKGKKIHSLTKPKRGSVYQDLFFNSNENYIPAPTVIITKKAWQKTGGFNENLTANDDYDMWLRIAKLFPIDYVEDVIAQYRWHATNLSNLSDKTYRNLIKIKKNFLQQNPDYRKKISLKKYYSICEDYLILFWIILNKKLFNDK